MSRYATASGEIAATNRDPQLSEEEERGIADALASLEAGQGKSLEEIRRTLKSKLAKWR